MNKGLIVGSLLALAAFAGCNGGTTTGSTPVVVNSPAPAPVSSVATLSAGTGATVTAPTVNGLSASFTLPTVTSSLATGSIAVSSWSQDPSALLGFTAFQSSKHVAQSTRATKSGTNTPIYFMTFTPSDSAGTATISGTITANFTIPSTSYPAGSNLYVAVYYPGASAWTEPVAGPGTVSGSTVTFTVNTTVTIAAGQTYGLAVYYTGTTTSLLPAPCGVTGATTAVQLTASTAFPTSTPLTGVGSGTLTYAFTSPSATGTLSVIPFATVPTQCPTLTATGFYGGVAVNPSVTESFTGPTLKFTLTPAPTIPFNTAAASINATGSTHLSVLDGTNPSAGWVDITSLANLTNTSTVVTSAPTTTGLAGTSLLAGHQYLFALWSK